jgi:peptidyl-prolyl cis-trans isomerase SurA
MRLTGVRGATKLLRSRRAGVACVLLCGLGVTGIMDAQKTEPQAPTPVKGQGVPLDRLVAVVNDDVILESDVDEEIRLAAFQPFRDPNRDNSHQQIIDRLINRALILEQAKLQPEQPITDKDVEEQFDSLRKVIPACKEYHCETDAGWNRYVTDQSFTMAELTKLWRQRMEMLRFIEERFRSGVEINQAEIRDYYEKTLLPQYVENHSTPPKLETISDRIQEILLQQQVTNLLEDWLKSLRAQGTVRIIQTGEALP